MQKLRRLQNKILVVIFGAFMVLLGILRIPESDLQEYLNYLSLSVDTDLGQYLQWFSKDPFFFILIYWIGNLTQVSWIFQGLVVCGFMSLLWTSLKGFGFSRIWIWILLITSSYVFSLELHLIRQMLATAIYLGVVSVDNSQKAVMRSIVAALFHFSFIPFVLLELILGKVLNVKVLILSIFVIFVISYLPGVLTLFQYAMIRLTAESYLDFGLPSFHLLVLTAMSPILAYRLRHYLHGQQLFTRILILSLLAFASLFVETEIFFRIVPTVIILLLVVIYSYTSRNLNRLALGVFINTGLLTYYIFYGKWSYHLL